MPVLMEISKTFFMSSSPIACNSYIFNWLFIVSLTARSFRDCHWFSLWEWYFNFYWYIEPQQSHMRFFLIHDRHVSGRVQSNLRATPDVNNHEFMQPHLSWETSVGPCPTESPGHIRRDQSWDQATYLWATVWVHITLPSVGNLSIRSSSFWQQWFQISRNSKH